MAASINDRALHSPLPTYSQPSSQSTCNFMQSFVGAATTPHCTSPRAPSTAPRTFSEGERSDTVQDHFGASIAMVSLLYPIVSSFKSPHPSPLMTSKCTMLIFILPATCLRLYGRPEVLWSSRAKSPSFVRSRTSRSSRGSLESRAWSWQSLCAVLVLWVLRL